MAEHKHDWLDGYCLNGCDVDWLSYFAALTAVVEAAREHRRECWDSHIKQCPMDAPFYKCSVCPAVATLDALEGQK